MKLSKQPLQLKSGDFAYNSKVAHQVNFAQCSSIRSVDAGSFELESWKFLSARIIYSVLVRVVGCHALVVQ